VGRGGDALDRFEAGWNRLAEGRKLAELRVLTLEDLPRLLATLTPARWALLARLREEGPLTIYELAKRLARDYKNVHTDVTRLIELGLIERAADGGVSVPWDVVRAEFGDGARTP
jgi:predicted transcriptional regulator